MTNRDQQVAQARELYRTGATYRDIADCLGINDGTVYKWCSDLATPRRVHVEKRDKARELYSSGKTFNEVVALVQASKSSVSIWCKDLIAEKKAIELKARQAKLLELEERNEARARRQKAKLEHNDSSRVLIRERKAKPAEGIFSEYYFYLSCRKNNVKHVNLVHRDTQETKSMTLGRYLVQVDLGRELEKHEIARQIKPGDTLDCFQVITREQIASDHKAKMTSSCSHCGNDFVKARVSSKFCSTACRDKGRAPRITTPRIKKTYTRKSPRKVIIHTCVCDICETEFESKNKHAVICRSQECLDIVKEYRYS